MPLPFFSDLSEQFEPDQLEELPLFLLRHPGPDSVGTQTLEVVIERGNRSRIASSPPSCMLDPGQIVGLRSDTSPFNVGVLLNFGRFMLISTVFPRLREPGVACLSGSARKLFERRDRGF